MSDELDPLPALIAIMRESGLDALTVRRGDARYEFVARSDPTAGGEGDPRPGATARPDPVSPPAAPAPVTAGPPASVRKVTAPFIGVFYRASSPGAEPFVEVGTRVDVGQPLCILEAMKMMNEITSEYAGVVRRVLPENGALVSLGEEMFWIEP